MRHFFTKLFWPILRVFENAGEGRHNYRPLHRKVLLVMGVLFLVLATVSVYFGLTAGRFAALIPIAVFFAAGIVCIVVGFLGSDRAVARIWGNK